MGKTNLGIDIKHDYFTSEYFSKLFIAMFTMLTVFGSKTS